MDEPETQSGPEVEQACKELWVHTAGEPQLGQWRGAFEERSVNQRHWRAWQYDGAFYGASGAGRPIWAARKSAKGPMFWSTLAASSAAMYCARD